MSLKPDDIYKIGHLARLSLGEEDVALYTLQLTNILDFIEQMNQTDTSLVKPLAHPLEISQRMRKDEVTETDEREKFQSLAPAVSAGLYLVSKVIEEA